MNIFKITVLILFQRPLIMEIQTVNEHQILWRKHKAVSAGQVFYIHRVDRYFFGYDYTIGVQHPLGQGDAASEERRLCPQSYRKSESPGIYPGYHSNGIYL